jgi:hypothetical protein
MKIVQDFCECVCLEIVLDTVGTLKFKFEDE